MKGKIIISIIAVVVIAIVSFFVFNKVQAPSPAEQAATVNTAAQSAVSGGVEKTNPFNVDVNPYQGYKNPFE